MKKCVIYSNCQADGLALFLPMMGFDYQITVYRNYQIIIGEQSMADLERDSKQCDLFVYQPTNDKHGDSSSENMLTKIPVHAETISFAYVYNHAFYPLTEHGGKYIGAEFINAGYWQMPLNELLNHYDQGTMDFALWSRFLHCLAEQARREENTDLKLTKWMLEHRNSRILLNVNHPTSIMFVELSAQLMHALGKDIRPFKVDHPENLTGLPCTLPHSAYISKFFGMPREADPDAHNYYRGLLKAEWTKQQYAEGFSAYTKEDELFGG